jgi:alkyldihydroxyacetonephosphate synthase
MASLLDASNRAISELRSQLGEHKVSTAVVDRLANNRGVWPVEIKSARRVLTGDGAFDLPACVVWPENPDDVCTVLRIADAHRVPVVPFGGGSGIVGGTAPLPASISLDTKRLTHLRIDEESMVAYAGPGHFGVDLERQLNERGLSLGHFPQSFHSSTLGGWVATRASGTFSTLHGNIEDRVVGLKVALPGGKLLTIRPSPRSATGPDLAQFFPGSEGALGVITEVVLWLHPANQHRVFQSYLFRSFQSGLVAVRRFVQAGARPGVVRLYDGSETAYKFPLFQFPPGSALLLLVFEGDEAIVDGHRSVVDRTCASSDGIERGVEPVDEWWRSRFDTGGLVAANSREGGYADAVEVSALWTDLARVYEAMLDAAGRNGAQAFAHVSHVYPSGAGLYVIVAGSSGNDEAAIQDYSTLVDDLLQACLANNGSISHHHGIGRAKSEWLARQQGEPGMALLTALKREADPHSIMNPGVLGLGI